MPIGIKKFSKFFLVYEDSVDNIINGKGKNMIKKAFFIVIGVVLLIWGIAVSKPMSVYTPHDPGGPFKALAGKYLTENLPSMPENWVYHKHVTDDGVVLRWGMSTPASEPKATIFFIPGYTDTLELHAGTFQQLTNRGYKVIAMDLRGQGLSQRMLKNPEKIWIDSFDTYKKDIAGLISSLDDEIDGKLIIAGNSLGGLSATYMLDDRTLPIDAAFLLVPALRVISDGVNPEDVVRQTGLFRALGFGERYTPGGTDWRPITVDFTEANYCGSNRMDKAHLKDAFYSLNPEYRVGAMSIGMVNEVFKAGAKTRSPAFLDNINVPILMVTGDRDLVVDSAAANEVCGQIEDCTLVRFAKAGHCINHELDEIVTEMFDRLDDFVIQLNAAS